MEADTKIQEKCKLIIRGKRKFIDEVNSDFEFVGNLSFTKFKHSDIDLIRRRYIPIINAIVPPLTPGTASAVPMKRPKVNNRE